MRGAFPAARRAAHYHPPPMSRSKDLIIVGLATASVALAILAWRQRVEIERLAPDAPRHGSRPAASITIHTASSRNVAVVPPRSAANLPEEFQAAMEQSDAAGGRNRLPERPRRKSALARLVDNPEFLHALGLHRQAVLDTRFAELFRRLKLSDEELAVFKRLLADKENVALDVVAISEGLPDGPLPADALRASVRKAREQVEDAIRDSLGRDRYEVYREFERTLGPRATIAQLEQRLSYSPTPLTPAQAESLVQIFANASPRAADPAAPAISVVVTAGATPMPLLPAGAPAGRITEVAIAQAQTVLAPGQMTALREIQAEQFAASQAAELVRELFPASDELREAGLTLLLQ